MRTLILILFTAGIAAAQTRTDWTTTNQVAPYSATINVPQVNVPQVTIPQANTVEIRSATNAPPAPRPPTRRNLVPLITAPSPGDMARRNLVATPPNLTPTPQPFSQTNTPAGSTVPTEIVSAIVAGHTWFVDRFGADANPGTSQQPLRTIQRAAGFAQPGDTVLVAPGAYPGFRTVRSGEKTRPITFRAQAANVIIGSPADRDDANIVVRDTSYIVIEGFSVRDSAAAGIAVANATGIVLRNNECAGNAGPGIVVSGGCPATTGALVDSNSLHHNGLTGLELLALADAVVQNNLVYHNGQKAGAAGIRLSSDPDCTLPATGNVIVNNTIVEPRRSALVFDERTRNNIVFNNIIVGDTPVAGELGNNQVDQDSNFERITDVGLFQSVTAGNYRLQPASPARNAGLAFYLGKTAPDRDRDGHPRTGHTVAAGAFE